MASTGNTQGIKFRIKPPKKAATSAHHNPPVSAGAAGALKGAAAKLLSALAETALSGQVPLTSASAWTLLPSSANSSPICAGCVLRWGDKGKRALQVAPCQVCVPASGGAAAPAPVASVLRTGSPGVALAAVTNTSTASGNTEIDLPCHCAGRPCALSTKLSPSSCACTLPASGVGRAARAASNSARCVATEPCSGRRSPNSPSCGMHSVRQTSQDALRRRAMSLAPGAGRKVGATVTVTGSKTVSS